MILEEVEIVVIAMYVYMNSLLRRDLYMNFFICEKHVSALLA